MHSEIKALSIQYQENNIHVSSENICDAVLSYWALWIEQSKEDLSEKDTIIVQLKNEVQALCDQLKERKGLVYEILGNVHSKYQDKGIESKLW